MTATPRNRFRYFYRPVWLVLCLILVAPLFPNDALKHVLPSLSPFLAYSRLTATGIFSLWILPALLVILLALFRRRWFCRHACPTGYLLETCGHWRPRNARRGAKIPFLARPMAWICIGTALAGYTVLLWMDPLSLFCGLGGLLRISSGQATWIAGAPVVLLMLITLLLPGVWCGKFCPLGGLQDLLADAAGLFRKKANAPAIKPDASRRDFLFILAGALPAWGLRRLRIEPHIIRPPGAAPREVFSGLCSRCGLCTAACPQDIIEPDLVRSGLAGLLTPILTFRHGYCDEWCNRCTQVCPTGALRPLSVEEKTLEILGTAEIRKNHCLAWADQKSCAVCQEFCPYQAVSLEEHNGVPCPSVDADLCRGCGACEKECPSLHIKAIQVAPRTT